MVCRSRPNEQILINLLGQFLAEINNELVCKLLQYSFLDQTLELFLQLLAPSLGIHLLGMVVWGQSTSSHRGYKDHRGESSFLTGFARDFRVLSGRSEAYEETRLFPSCQLGCAAP